MLSISKIRKINSSVVQGKPAEDVMNLINPGTLTAGEFRDVVNNVISTIETNCESRYPERLRDLLKQELNNQLDKLCNSDALSSIVTDSYQKVINETLIAELIALIQKISIMQTYLPREPRAEDSFARAALDFSPNRAQSHVVAGFGLPEVVERSMVSLEEVNMGPDVEPGYRVVDEMSQWGSELIVEAPGLGPQPTAAQLVTAFSTWDSEEEVESDASSGCAIR